MSGKQLYLRMLEEGYRDSLENECAPESRLEFLGEYVFDFTTYHGEMAALFASKALEVCQAISDGTTFKYIEDPDNYRWYLLMCNMPFFADKLEWGGSIRGAWWSYKIKFRCYGLFLDGAQVMTDDTKFTKEEWMEFVAAMIEFGKGDANLCACKDRDQSACPGEWEPGCDLGNNPAHVRVVE